MRAVFNHAGGHDHRRPGDGFSIGKVDGSVNEVLEVVAVSNFNVDFGVSISEGRDVGGSERSEKHQQHQENGLCFRVC